MKSRTTNFDTFLLRENDPPQHDKSRDIAAQRLFSKLLYALNQSDYKSTVDDFTALNKSDGVLLSNESDFWAVSYVLNGLQQPAALFLEVDDAVQFFLGKLTRDELSIGDIERLVATGWNPSDAVTVHQGLHSAFRTDLFSH